MDENSKLQVMKLGKTLDDKTINKAKDKIKEVQKLIEAKKAAVEDEV